jgi:hypothetical protein
MFTKNSDTGMPILAVLLLLWVLNWVVNTALIFTPLTLLHPLGHWFWLGIGVLLLGFLAWCLGDEPT